MSCAFNLEGNKRGRFWSEPTSVTQIYNTRRKIFLWCAHAYLMIALISSLVAHEKEISEGKVSQISLSNFKN